MSSITEFQLNEQAINFNKLECNDGEKLFSLFGFQLTAFKGKLLKLLCSTEFVVRYLTMLISRD